MTKKNYWFLNFYFCLTLMPYVMLCFFNYPSSDDFAFTASTYGRNFLETQACWYTGWSGRYTATALLTFVNPLIYHWMYGYRILSLVIIGGIFFTVFSLVRSFLGGRLSTSNEWLLTFFFVSFYFSLLPHLAGGIYWMAGSLTHATPTILVGLSIALLKRKNANFFVDYLLLPFMTFLIVGCNETIMITWMTLLLLVNIYLLTKNKRIDTFFAVLFAVGLIGSLLVYFAPGNAIRAHDFSKAHRPFFALSNTVVYMIIYTFLFGSVPFALFLAWVAINAKRIQERLQWHWVNKQSLKLMVIVFFVIQFCTFFTSLWAKGGKPPEYVYNMTILFYFPLLTLITLQSAILYPSRFGFLEPFKLNKRGMMISFFILFLFLGNNGRAIYDTVWAAPRYSAELKMRQDIINSFQGKDLAVKELHYKPKSIFYSDIEKNPLDYKNLTYSQYFNLKSIILEPDKSKTVGEK